jgi:hypothetical protein
MSETKHTPGPWKVGGISLNTGAIAINHPEYRLVIADVLNAASFGDFVTASIRGRRDFGSPDTAKTQWANARLIAAAPDGHEFASAPEWERIANAVDRYSRGDTSPLVALGIISTAFLLLENKRVAFLAKAEGRTDA